MRARIDATQITKWQYGKTGAVSLTYDDGSINQFRIAVPIMDSFNFPATFFIITGEIPGSRYHGTFIGRPKTGHHPRDGYHADQPRQLF